MRVKKFKEPVFAAEVLVIVDCSPKEREEYLGKHGFPTDLSKGQYGAITTSFRQVKEDGREAIAYLIWIENKEQFYSAMHECIHLVKRLFEDRGIPFDATNDEVIAYYHEYWFRKVWRFMNKE